MVNDEVVLLSTWFSPFGMRVQIALIERGIQYQYIEENLFEKSPFLLQTNPIHKKVPVLIHNGNPICESLAVVQYIDEVWPDKAPLLPSNPYDRAVARFWADYVDKKIYGTGRRICLSKGEDQEKAKEELIEYLKVLEGELGEKKFFGGESFGLVDVALVPFYTRFYAYDKCGNFSVESECPKIMEWAKRCLERESVAQTFPEQEKVYEFVLMLKKRFGVD